MLSRSSMRVVVLGSGSGGNATAVTDGHTTVLVDCGFSARDIARRLTANGIEPASVSAIVLTHEHSDHVRGVDVFARRHAPMSIVYATAGTAGRTPLDAIRERVVTLMRGESVRIGTLDVLPFATSHDATEPCGYRFDSEQGSAGIATDTGVLTEEAREALAGVNVLGLECNHDVEMLERGPYPSFLKRRIRSASGHLSNHDSADAVERLAHDGLTCLLALHRSRTNNTIRLAEQTLTARLSRMGLDIPVTVASQNEPCDSLPPQGRLFG